MWKVQYVKRVIVTRTYTGQGLGRSKESDCLKGLGVCNATSANLAISNGPGRPVYQHQLTIDGTGELCWMIIPSDKVRIRKHPQLDTGASLPYNIDSK